MDVPWGRFDDLPARRSIELRATRGLLVADRPADVARVLADVDAAAADGLWAFGFVAYEAATALDPTLVAHPPVEGLPLAWFGLCDPPRAVPPVEPAGGAGYRTGPWADPWSPDQYRAAVGASRAGIARGDTYQVNLTSRLTGEVHGDLEALYRDLALRGGGSHNAYLDTGRFAVVGASPELFFEWSGDRVAMRPMKGTAPRGDTPAEDSDRQEELRASPKELAENVMIVDLLRNDLARLSTVGGVDVPRLWTLESYPTVHQLTSQVRARLRPDVGLVDVFGALFPSGSVTGAPKAATMRIIRDLEVGPRGVYCGAVGVVAPPGGQPRASFNVPIRTLLVDREHDRGMYGVGSGITWGSDPDAELLELHAKTRVLTGLPGAVPLGL